MDFNGIYYSDGEISLGSKDGMTYLVRDKMFYLLTDYPWEPCLYVKSWDRKLKTLHHAFTVERLIELAKNGGTMELIRDTEFDVPQILRTILRAMELPLDDMDIDYAWHGIPVRNDDMITYAEISEEEYEQIRREYPQQRQADSSEAQRFQDRYVEGHAVLAEGMNVSLPKGE